MPDTGRRPRSLAVLALTTMLVLAAAPSAAAVEPPANDELSGATAIAVPSVTTQDTSAATANGIDPGCFAGPRLGATVWFTFTTGSDDYGTYYIDTFGSDYDTTVAFYSPDQTDVYCTYDSKGTKQTYIAAQIYPDTTYFLLVGSAAESTPGGTLVLNVTDQAPPPPTVPPNDDIANATEITSLPFRDAFDASLATPAATDPVPYGDFLCYFGPTPANSVWYRFTAGADTYVQLDTFGGEFRNTLTVFAGTPDALVQVTDCDVDGGTPDEYAPWVEFAATAGTTYYILVTAYPTEPAGFLVLNARETVPFTIDVRIERIWVVNPDYVIARVTLTCSKFGYIGLTGQLTQTTKSRNAFGSFFDPPTCSDQQPREFVISADPESPDHFGVGRATLHLEARGESHETIDVEVVDTTVQLRAGR